MPARDRLAPYAVQSTASRGRLHDEPESRTRTPFARDRDRVIHATAFRRLKGKTQVFVAHEGDYYRTRLTHSLEVAQIARALATALSLDADLAEGAALAHDLGHPAFGHAGEEALAACMSAFGGFDHNVQTFRVVTELERQYPTFAGLNLTWETLEAVLKHNGPVAGRLGEPAWSAVAAYDRRQPLALDTFASAEAQVAAIADDIAYNNHDVDDGLRAGLFSLADLAQAPLIGAIVDGVRRDHPALDDRLLRLEAVRRMIGAMVDDVLAATRAAVAATGVESAEAVRRLGRPLVGFSPARLEDLARLRAFLFARMYRHPRVNRSRRVAARVMTELFARFNQEPSALPPDWSARAEGRDERARARLVCDYLAGMTDRFALDEHRRLTGLDLGDP